MSNISPLQAQYALEFPIESEACTLSVDKSFDTPETSSPQPEDTDSQRERYALSRVSNTIANVDNIASPPANANQTIAPAGRKPRKVSHNPITCLADILDDTETAFHNVLDAQKCGVMPTVARVGLGQVVAHTRRDKRNLRNARDRMISKGVLEIWGEAEFRGATVYHLFTDEEVLASLSAAGLTHWVRCGRGKKILKLGVTPEGKLERHEAN